MNKNLICEVDEGTRRMIEHIKDSVASGIEPSLTGNSKQIQDLSYIADNILTTIQETKTGLLSKVKNVLDGIKDIEMEVSSISTNLDKIEKIPDFSNLSIGIDKAIEGIGNLESNLSDTKSELHNTEISLSEKIQESENSQVKKVTEFVSPHFEKIQFLLEEQKSLLSVSLNKILETIDNSKDAITKRLLTTETALSSSIVSLKNMIEKEREEREKYQLAVDTKLNNIMEMLDSLNKSVNDGKERNEVHNVSITERLQEILVMVTPFWKKKKSKNNEK